MSLILASASTARASMLRGAGVAIEVVPMRVDEESLTAALLADGAAAREIADALADLKARRGSERFPGRLVLGADQVLVCDGKLVGKARDLAEAATTLRALRDKPHELFSAAVVYENGTPIWRHIGKARLVMRNFTDAFLQGYIERGGDAILTSVGCYQLEGEGAQLFSRVEGDYFTILGLPLLEVLGFLRVRGVLVE
jgi:septum formation protein